MVDVLHKLSLAMVNLQLRGATGGRPEPLYLLSFLAKSWPTACLTLLLLSC